MTASSSKIVNNGLRSRMSRCPSEYGRLTLSQIPIEYLVRNLRRLYDSEPRSSLNGLHGCIGLPSALNFNSDSHGDDDLAPRQLQ